MSRCKYRSYNQQHHHLQQQRSFFLPIMLCSRSSVKDVKLPHSHHHHHYQPNISPTTTTVGCVGHAKRNNKVVGLPTNPNKLNPSFSSSTSTNKSLNSSSNNNNDNNNAVATTTNNNTARYQKIKQCFFSKSLTNSPTSSSYTALPPAAEKPTAGGGGSGCEVVRRRDYSTGGNSSTCRIRSKCVGGGGDGYCRIRGGGVRDSEQQIDLASLDPPLPVVKRLPQQPLGAAGRRGEERDSLWKRRSGGAPALRCLQVVQSVNNTGAVVAAEANTV